MTEEQIKKLIIAANLDNLKLEDFLEKVKTMIQAAIDNPTIVTDITPEPGDVSNKVDKIEGYVLENNVLTQKQKNNTGKIKDLVKDIKNDIASKWANQVQNTPGMDKNKAALLGFGSKGFDDGHSEPEVSVNNSNPMIAMLDASRHLEHTLIIRNNVTGKIALPPDAKDIDVYMYIGKDEPADFRKSATYLGVAKRGKYTVTFGEDQVGQTVWYFVVYKPRKSGNGNLLASKVKTVVA